MPPKSERERLFGAACVRVTLERMGRDPGDLGLYRETLRDLGVADEEVVRFLQAHRSEVETKLDSHGGGGHGRR